MVVMDYGNSYNNEKIYLFGSCLPSDLLNIITTCYALGHYFMKVSDPSYLMQLKIH